MLTISDGAPGLCAAIDQIFPQARRQRCLIHRARNTLAKVADVDQTAVRADYWEIFDLPEDLAPGEAAVAEAHQRAEAFAVTWGRNYPGAVACVTEGFDELTATCTIRARTGAGCATPTSSSAPLERPAAV